MLENWELLQSLEYLKLKITFWGRFFWHTRYVLVLDVSRFSRLRSQTRSMTKQNETDINSVYLIIGRYTVTGLPGFHALLGADIKGSFLSNGEKKCR